MAFSNDALDPKNGLYKIKMYNPKTDYKEFKAKPYVQPPYKDPLRAEHKEFKGNFEIPKYKPYKPTPMKHEFKEYKGPFVDPLTGKPYNRGRKKKPNTPVPEEEEPPPKPIPKVYIPYNFGPTTGSTKRTLRISNSLNF